MASVRLVDPSCTEGLTTRIIGTVINFYDSVTSTNDLALELARGGCDEGIVVVARSQTSGRGREGRKFHSPEGGLYLSAVLRPDATPVEAAPLPLIFCMAVSKAVGCTMLVETSLKWPNDVLLKGRKLCGILHESSVKGGRLEYLVTGIGINANSTSSDLPEELLANTTTLREELGRQVDMNELLRNVLYFMDLEYTRFLDGQTRILLDQWSERSSTVGKEVKVAAADGEMTGKALGVDQTGALMISSMGTIHRIGYGDCQHLD